MDNAPVPRQRSPWFYVLLGCGGLAGLMCLGLGGSGLVCAKQMHNVKQGLENPEQRQANAVEQLGTIPPGYQVVASFSMMGLSKATYLTDQPLLADGGIPSGGRQFAYQLMRGETGAIQAFFDGSDPEARQLAASPVQIQLPVDPAHVIRRGQLLLDGRKIVYLVGRQAAGPRQPTPVLSTLVSFDCPDKVLRFGVWSQVDPAPEAGPDAPRLEGTVADEAELAKFLKPLTPCGR